MAALKSSISAGVALRSLAVIGISTSLCASHTNFRSHDIAALAKQMAWHESNASNDEHISRLAMLTPAIRQ